MNELPQSVAIARPDPALIDSAGRYLASARTSYAVISSADEYEAAGLDLQSIKTVQKKLEADRTSISGPINQALKALNALFKKPAEALEEAERVIKRSMICYQNVEEEKRRKLEAEAAERARKEREKLEAQAKKAEEAGKVEKAEGLRQAAEFIPQNVQISSSTPKVAGVATRGTWKATVKDKAAFVSYVAQHPEWLHLVDVNTTALNGLARSQKSSLALPGVEAVEEREISARAA